MASVRRAQVGAVMRAALLLIVCLFASQSFAQTVEWDYCARSSPGPFVSSSITGTFSLWLACVNSACGGNPGTVLYTDEGCTGGPSSGNCAWNAYHHPGGGLITTGSQPFCAYDVAAECDWDVAQALPMSGYHYGITTVPEGGTESCHPASQCKISITGPIVQVGTQWASRWTVQNAPCETEDPLPGTPGGSCINGGGNTVCASSADQAMVVNGDKVPPAGLDEGQCAVYASGGSACVVEAGDTPTSPPAPDNGTPGTPATPVASVTNVTNNTTTNYYNNTTTAGSTSAVNGQPGQNVGAQSGSPDGDGDGDGEGDCLEGDCSGAFPENESVCTIAECAEDFFNRVMEAPLVASVLDAGSSVPAGACPSWGITAFGDTNSLSAPMCAIFDDIAPMLSAAFLLIWAWVATRIVLSA